jgi:hypothetical protein
MGPSNGSYYAAYNQKGGPKAARWVHISLRR